ncbi:MAG: response regulator [Magnetococcales bacterium]|nr:response regulator [Magnetococcales bacterium]
MEHLITTLQSWSGTRLLWTGVVVSELVTVVMVGLLSLFIHGEFRADFLLTGTITALVASVLVVSVLNRLILRIRLAEQRVQEAERTKSEFLSTVSHEIRTPMNVIIGMGDALLSSVGMSAEQLGYVKKQQRAGAVLLQLIDQVLALSRLEEGVHHPTREVLELRQLLEEMAEWIRAGAEAKSLRVEWRADEALPVRIAVDGLHLRQVLMHLLGNAVKFTNQGVVRLGAVREGGLLHLTVSDTGIGIDADFMARLFRPFCQADGAPTRRYGGTGLGLAVSRALIGKMEGSLTAESQPGQGTTFHIRLPLQEVEEGPVAAAPSVETPSEEVCGKRILLVEDDRDNRLLIETFLQQSPHHLSMAENGLEAVRKVREEAFDLVIMDVQMPVMDGYTSARAIRQWERETGRRSLRIVTLTANAVDGEEIRSREAGCDQFLTKPIRKKRLLEVIQGDRLLS